MIECRGDGDNEEILRVNEVSGVVDIWIEGGIVPRNKKLTRKRSKAQG